MNTTGSISGDLEAMANGRWPIARKIAARKRRLGRLVTWALMALVIAALLACAGVLSAVSGLSWSACFALFVAFLASVGAICNHWLGRGPTPSMSEAEALRQLLHAQDAGNHADFMQAHETLMKAHTK